ncbi:MAG: APC family permease [Thermoplasmata archaeon]
MPDRPPGPPPAASAPRTRPSLSDAPLRRLGKVELLGAGAAFVAPAFSLAAIFTLLALKGGRYAWVGVVLGLLAVLLTGVCFARMTARHPKAGGAYALVGAELSLPVGFIAGWALCLLYLLGPAIPLLLFVTLLEVFLPQTAGALIPIAAVVAVGVFGLNALGLRPSSRVALAVFVAEAAILLGVAAALFLQPAAALPAPPATPLDTLIALGGSGGAAVFLFLGFESVSAYAEEARLPARDIAWGTGATILATGVVYVVSALAYLHAIPASQWGSTGASLPTAVGSVLGTNGGRLVTAVIIVSSLGAMICVENACARVLFAMGRDRVLPYPLARLFGREKAPWPALAVSAVAAFGLVWWSTVSMGVLSAPPAFLLVLLPELLVFGALVAYALLSLAYLVALVREGVARSAPWRLAVPLASLGVTGTLLVLQVLPGTPGWNDVLVWGTAWLLVGFGVWGATWFSSRTNPTRSAGEPSGES